MDNISSLLFPFFYPKVGKNYKLENAIAFIVKRYDGAVFRSSPPELFSGKGIQKMCCKFTGEHRCRSVISIKLFYKFVKITLQHGCSPVTLLHIFKTSFPKNTYEGLLPSVTYFQHTGKVRLGTYTWDPGPYTWDPGPGSHRWGPGTRELASGTQDPGPYYIETSPLICSDWFLCDGDLRHERVNELYVLDQVRGVIRALQSYMMILLKKSSLTTLIQGLKLFTKIIILVA